MQIQLFLLPFLFQNASYSKTKYFIFVSNFPFSQIILILLVFFSLFKNILLQKNPCCQKKKKTSWETRSISLVNNFRHSYPIVFINVHSIVTIQWKTEYNFVQTHGLQCERLIVCYFSNFYILELLNQLHAFIIIFPSSPFIYPPKGFPKIKTHHIYHRTHVIGRDDILFILIWVLHLHHWRLKNIFFWKHIARATPPFFEAHLYIIKNTSRSNLPLL